MRDLKLYYKEYKEKNEEALRYRTKRNQKRFRENLKLKSKEDLTFGSTDKALNLFYLGNYLKDIKAKDIEPLSIITGLAPNMILSLRNNVYKGTNYLLNKITEGMKKLNI